MPDGAGKAAKLMTADDIARWVAYPTGCGAPSDVELARAVAEGLPAGAAEALVTRRVLTPDELRRLVVPRRTLAYRKQHRQRLTADESERVVRAARVMHGKTSDIVHDGTGLFAGLPSPLPVMRYHSLVVERDSLPPALEITAVAADDPLEIHALRHREHPVWGVQFHPESILTTGGMHLLRNFLAMTG